MAPDPNSRSPSDAAVPPKRAASAAGNQERTGGSRGEEPPPDGDPGESAAAVLLENLMYRPGRFLRDGVAYYGQQLPFLRDCLIQTLPQLAHSNSRRELRLAAAMPPPGAIRSEDGWEVELPDCCAICAAPTETSRQQETRTSPDLTGPFWGPVVGVAAGIVPGFCLAGIFAPAIGLIAGCLAGYALRRQEDVVFSLKRCERHAEHRKTPAVYQFAGELIVRVGTPRVKRLFLDRIRRADESAEPPRKRKPRIADPPRPVRPPPLPPTGARAPILRQPRPSSPLAAVPQEREPDEEWDEPARVETSEPGWARAQSGLNLVYIGGVLMNAALAVVLSLMIVGIAAAMLSLGPHERVSSGALLGVICLMMGPLLAGIYYFVDDQFVPLALGMALPPIALASGSPVIAGSLFVLAGAVAVAAALVVLVGLILCLGVPAGSAPRVLMLGALGSFLAALACGAAAPLLAGEESAALRDQSARVLPWTAGAASVVFGIAAHVLFVLFLRDVARVFHDRATEGYIMAYLRFWAVLVSVSLLVAGVGLLGAVSGVGLMLLQLPIAGLGIAQVIWFVRAVAGARDSIRVSVEAPG